MKRNQRKPIHFIFKSHGKNDATALGKNVRRARTLVFEKVGGHPNQEPLTIERGFNRRSKAFYRFVKMTQKRRKNIVAGETAGPINEKQELSGLLRIQKTYLSHLSGPNQIPLSAVLEAGKQYFAASAAINILRHQLIRRTIKWSPKPVVAEYGTVHSLLSGELQREGISSSREMPSQAFSPAAVVLRKLIIGKNPSDLDYKRGIIDLTLRPPIVRDNDKQNREEALARSVLIRNLSGNQLDEILRTRNELLVLTFNGLPTNATFGQIKQFVKKHSAFWKHERIARRKRNKAKKQQWNTRQ